MKGLWLAFRIGLASAFFLAAILLFSPSYPYKQSPAGSPEVEASVANPHAPQGFTSSEQAGNPVVYLNGIPHVVVGSSAVSLKFEKSFVTGGTWLQGTDVWSGTCEATWGGVYGGSTVVALQPQTFTPPTMTLSKLFGSIPEINSNTIVPESLGHSIKGLAIVLGTVSAFAGTAIYRLQHFVGRLGIASRDSVKLLQFSLLSLAYFVAMFLLRVLHLPGSNGPSIGTTCLSIVTAVCSANSGSFDSSKKEFCVCLNTHSSSWSPA